MKLEVETSLYKKLIINRKKMVWKMVLMNFIITCHLKMDYGFVKFGKIKFLEKIDFLINFF